MIRLEGATLPPESRGAVPPVLFGDLLRDVPGIPLQVGWTATLADSCGVTESELVLTLSGPEIAEVLAVVPASGVVQLDAEWLEYSGKRTTPPGLFITARGFAETDPAAHGRGTTVYFVETRPIYVLACAPPGCTYPHDMVQELRVNGLAHTPPCTIRLQDDRLIPGVRLVTAEFDARRAFFTPPAPVLPSTVILAATDAGAPVGDAAARAGGAGHAGFAGGPLGAAPAGLTGYGGRPTARGWLTPAPARPTLAPGAAPFAPRPVTVSLRQGPLGRVTADLKGLLDTGAGRYTGTPHAPLRTPAHIVRLLLEDTYGETDPAQYHAPTWAATAARQAALGLTWRLAWTGDAFEAFREAAQACGQAELYVDEAGRWRYALREPGPVVGTLTPRELLGEPGLGWTAGRDVITVLEVAWGIGLQAGSFTLTSPDMIARHGENHGALTLPYAATEAAARRLGRHALSRRDRPRFRATVATAPAWLGLTLRDRVHVDTPLLALYGARTPFEVIALTDRGAERVLTLLEGDPLAPVLLLSGTLLRPGAVVGLPLTGTLDVGAGLVILSLSGTRILPASLTRTLTGTLELVTLGPGYFGEPYFAPTYFADAYFLRPAAITVAWDAAGAAWDTGVWDP